jgi:hypothetical protein
MGNLGVNISVMVIASILGVMNLASCWKSVSFAGGIKSDFSVLEMKQMAICLINCGLLLFFSASFRDVFNLGISPLIVMCAANLMGFGNAMALFNPLFSALEVERSEVSEEALSKFLNRNQRVISALESVLPFALIAVVVGVSLIEIYVDLYTFHVIWAAFITFSCVLTNHFIKKLLTKVEDSLQKIELEIKSSGGGQFNTGAQLRLLKSQDLKQRLTQTFGAIATAVLLNIVLLIMSALIKVGPNDAFSPDGASYTVVPELIVYFTIAAVFPMTLVMWTTQFVHKAKVQAVQNQPSGNSHEAGKGSSGHKLSTEGPRLPSAIDGPASRNMSTEAV